MRWKFPRLAGHNALLEARWRAGVWLGRLWASPVHLVYDPAEKCVREVRAVQRMPQVDRWDREALQAVSVWPRRLDPAPDVGEARALKLAEGDSELNAETKKQDAYLDEMSDLLGEITEMGRDVQETIVKQNAMIQDIQNESESLREDLHDITQNSKVMRKVKVKMVAEKEKKKSRPRKQR